MAGDAASSQITVRFLAVTVCLLRSRGRGAKYCDEHIYLSVCLSVCQSTHVITHGLTLCGLTGDPSP